MVLGWIFVLAIVSIAVAAYRLRSFKRFAKPSNADRFVVEKVGSATRVKFGVAVGYVAGVAFLATWFGYIGMFLHYDATRPMKPDTRTGALISQNNHGHIVYLTGREEDVLLSLQRASIGLAFVGVLATYVYKRMTKGLPE
jgi:hypothetical protein